MRSYRSAFAAVASSFFFFSCGTSEPQGRACSPSEANASCTPLYDPTFDQVWEKTLKPTCAASGASCHSSRGRQGGLAFEDKEESYTLITRENGPIVAGDPKCSEVVARIMATSGKVRMPPGRSLDVGEQCSIIQWIANGAKR